MEPQMPRALPNSFSHTAGAHYATAVRAAVSNTLDTLNERFCEAYERSGCTCTVAVYCGALLTVANIGDSDAVLDAFSEMMTMTVCHTNLLSSVYNMVNVRRVTMHRQLCMASSFRTRMYNGLLELNWRCLCLC